MWHRPVTAPVVIVTTQADDIGPDHVDVVRSVAGAITVERDRVKGSRFVADLAPASDDASALATVAAIRTRHADASHHCWAFRLASGRARSDDDGEPGGTGGPPILRHLDGARLADVVCVVTRWYGGTKLGTGGLARAYGAAAAAAIEEAVIVEQPRLTHFEVTHPWDLTAPVQAVLAGHDAATVDADYGVDVHLSVSVAATRAGDFEAAIMEATSGRVAAVRS